MSRIVYLALEVKGSSVPVPLGWIHDPEVSPRLDLAGMISGECRGPDHAPAIPHLVEATKRPGAPLSFVVMDVVDFERATGPAWRGRYFVESFTPPDECGHFEITLGGTGAPLVAIPAEPAT